MANIQSAKKRARQAIKRRAHNISIKSRAYTFIKKARKLIEAGAKDEAGVAVKAAMHEIDQITAKGLFHKNKAARLKSRLNASLKKLAA